MSRPSGGPAWAAGLGLAVLLVAGVWVHLRPGDEPIPQRRAETLAFVHTGRDVVVSFRGEVSSEALFGAAGLSIHPVDSTQSPVGIARASTPNWLEFRYSIGGETREVLIAAEPLLGFVSWDEIARAGAALGDGSAVVLGVDTFPQTARVEDRFGRSYRVRLPTCGQATRDDLSEWNLLIGAAHEGDRDFLGPRFGWISDPRSDEDLAVGYGGTLSWCMEAWDRDPSYRVTRGYFLASRFHATPSALQTPRLHWRPVLEREDVTMEFGGHEADLLVADEEADALVDRSTTFLGVRSNDEVFGRDGRLTNQVNLPMGIYVEGGRPDWLAFEHRGSQLLVASRAIRFGVSWEAIARAGAVRGDGSLLRVGDSEHPQDAEVVDALGTRYRVRLLECGAATMDHDSEWNALIGGLHVGDGDFRPAEDGRYGWAPISLGDTDLGIGEGLGMTTWCRNRETVQNRPYAVNRGFLTVSRFHLTETDYFDPAFGWRPVLERVER